MTVAKIMTHNPITIGPELTIGELYPLFQKHNIHHLLVVRDQQLIGIISDRDALRNLSPFANTQAASAKDTFTLNRRAEHIMSTKVITVSPDFGIREACDRLLNAGVSLLPVVVQGQPVGVLSWRDILKYFTR